MYFSSKVLSSIFMAAAMAASVSADDHLKKPSGKEDYGKEPWGKHGDTDGSPALTDLASGAHGVCGFTRTTLPPVTRTQVVLETDMATVVQCEVTTTTTSTVCSTTTICENTPTGNPIEPATCTTGDDHYKPTPEPYYNAGKGGQEGPDGPAKPIDSEDDDSEDDDDDDDDDDSEPTITAAARRFRA